MDSSLYKDTSQGAAMKVAVVEDGSSPSNNSSPSSSEVTTNTPASFTFAESQAGITLFAANPNAKTREIINFTDGFLFVRLADEAATSSRFDRVIPAQSSAGGPSQYKGIVRAILFGATNGNVYVSEGS